MEISLGPAPLSWGRERLMGFYQEMAESKVDNFYLGEIFCPKRGHLFREDLIRIADLLSKEGKRIYISSYGLIRTEEEIEDIEYLLKGAAGIEINNVAILEMRIKEKELVAGPLLNIYNSHSARYLRRFGIKKIVIPPELGWKEVSQMIEAVDADFEYLVHGSLSLGLFPDCYTTRALGLDGRACEGICLRYPEGMSLKTLSGEILFNLNGPEISSAKIYCLINYLEDMKGLHSVRIKPQIQGTREMVALYRKAIDRQTEEGRELAERYSRYGLSNGWFFGEAGWQYCNGRVPSGRTEVRENIG